jgi:farnesyl-diphosphate farnesyltransferase
MATPPTTHEGYMSLLNEFPGLLNEVGKLDAASRDVIFLHGRRTAEGMKEILLRGRKQDRLELTGMDDLKHYCYVVAGIVGELLTALFLIDAPALGSARSVLEANQVAFGEGLQLVNILKDRLADANSGRSFVPDSIDTADVFALARQDLVCAGVYVDALRADGVPTGFAAFTGLSASLANATLDILEKQGPGAKLSRGEVQRIYANVTPASSQSQISVDR